MVLSIYQCDLCGSDCSEYRNRVYCNFPNGDQKHICINCANKIFGVNKDGENNNE